MDDGLGRDIGPDEDRLNYVYNGPSNGIHEPVENGMSEDQSLISQSIHRRIGFRLQEPVDTTTDAPETIHNQTFPQHRQPGPNTPDYYKSEVNRLSTFSDWRYQHVVRKEDLARNGFVFTGSGDKVRCVYCNVILRSWEAGDVVEQEHRRNAASCPFLSGQNVGNIPLEPGSYPSFQTTFMNPAATVSDARSARALNGGHDIDPIEEGYGGCSMLQISRSNSVHESDAVSGKNNATGDKIPTRRVYSNMPRHPHMSVEPDRRATFSSWPAQMKQKPDELAQAGLFYIGDGDKVKCFHCDGLLYNWEPEDDPFVEHARWFPACQYIKLVKGENFVDDVQQGRVTQDEVMHTPAVLAVLHDGHSVESVQRALAAMRKKNGASAVVSAQNLLMTIMELEDEVAGRPEENGRVSSEDLKKLQRENESLRDKQLCKICMERDMEVIFLPCKHLVCCASCSTAVRACPICRVTIEGIDKIFMA